MFSIKSLKSNNTTYGVLTAEIMKQVAQIGAPDVLHYALAYPQIMRDGFFKDSPLLRMFESSRVNGEASKAYNFDLTDLQYSIDLVDVNKLGDKVSGATAFASDGKFGQGGTEIKVAFEGAQGFKFLDGHAIIARSVSLNQIIQCQIKEITPTASGYIATIIQHRTSRESYIPGDVLQAGIVWRETFRAIPRDNHDASNQRLSGHSKKIGNTGLTRSDHSWSESAIGLKYNIPVPVRGSGFSADGTAQMDFASYVLTGQEMRTLTDHFRKVEEMCLFNVGNYDVDSDSYLNIDPATGEVLPLNRGLIHTITQGDGVHDSYDDWRQAWPVLESTVMKLRLRKNGFVGGPRTFGFITGTGGMLNFRESAKEHMLNYGIGVQSAYGSYAVSKNWDGKSLAGQDLGTNTGLLFGENITAMKTATGDTIVCMYEPALDFAGYSLAHGLYTPSMYPVFGYNYYIVDMTPRLGPDGLVSNFFKVSYKGLKALDILVLGATSGTPEIQANPLGNQRSSTVARNTRSIISSASMDIADTSLCADVIFETSNTTDTPVNF